MGTHLLEAYGRWVVRHRWTVLAAVLATTVLLGRAATHLRVEVDPDRQLPQDHPFIQTLNDVHRIFGDKNLVVVGLFPHDGNVFTPSFLKKLAEVTDRLRRIPGANQSLLQSLAAPQVKAIRGTTEGMEVERVMETPPTDMAGAEDVRRRAFSNDAYVGTLVAADGSAAAVQASFELTPETPGYRHLHAAVVAALKAADDGTFDYSLSGPVVFLAQLTAGIDRDAGDHVAPRSAVVPEGAFEPLVPSFFEIREVDRVVDVVVGVEVTPTDLDPLLVHPIKPPRRPGSPPPEGRGVPRPAGGSARESLVRRRRPCRCSGRGPGARRPSLRGR